MKKKTLVAIFALVMGINVLFAQNTSEVLMNSDQKLTIGGYAQIDYNQKFSSDTRSNGNLDVHRMVLMFGYRFNAKTQFIAEVEYEHVKEVFIEQAFLNYQINDWLNFRGGLMLIPMGIINEYHEPTTFNGVERPNLDSNIAPTTWREVGAGFTGRVQDLNIKYQLYVVNGFNSYDGEGNLKGSNGFRSGRQKGAESFMSSPNLAAKVDYYGVPGLKLGLSGYFGDTQSTLYDGLDKNDRAAEAKADSSVVGISMLGADASYSLKGLVLKGQLYYSSMSNTDKYNDFTGKDLGSAMLGYYLEAGYDILSAKNSEQKLIPFVRYEKYNTHHKTDGIAENPAYDRTDFTAGLGWWLTSGAVLKADLQWFDNEAASTKTKQFNLGIGIWF
ncbi:hypothetical protein [Mangrovibacterium lignilyticum]|uniref:hypothetical protein n=1 Tax=Mangrovibacterium lignilyticum TaxID=2668052 RepID=UPI001968989E|nr:hypothetical protein [Mangrovibacterium lignilyticum]